MRPFAQRAVPPRSLRSRAADGDGYEDAEEISTPTRRFSLLEITSGLPDDSREADEKQAERRLREIRARVKLARAVVSRTPGLAAILATDWRKAARFYARFGIAEAMFRHGVPPGSHEQEVDLPNLAWPPAFELSKLKARRSGPLSLSGSDLYGDNPC
jgi:hypothetical protein